MFRCVCVLLLCVLVLVHVVLCCSLGSVMCLTSWLVGLCVSWLVYLLVLVGGLVGRPVRVLFERSVGRVCGR